MDIYDAMKTVVYFVGMIDATSAKRQESEISEINIVSVEKAYELLNFDNSKELLLKAKNFLNK